jgi:glutamate--cysteine ligase
MDLDPFVAIGIEAQTMRFLDVFLLHCLLSDSPLDTPQEVAELAHNQHRTAARGREPGLTLARGGRELTLRAWGGQLLDECAPLAAALDSAHGSKRYSEALKAAGAGLAEPDSLPSARVLAAMAQGHENSFLGFGRAQSLQMKKRLLSLPYGDALQARFRAMTQKSLADQKAIEAADTMPFDIYRERYLSPERLGLGKPAARTA